MELMTAEERDEEGSTLSAKMAFADSGYQSGGANS